MDKVNTKQEITMTLVKSEAYKIIIPKDVEDKIRYICSQVWDVEWSGTLFYNIEGSFENKDLKIICKDIFVQDIGTTTYTEFTVSPNVSGYMVDHPELLQCNLGLIHSHNNMATFFSGTDLSTLKEEGSERNHFVSLIVNNKGLYTAAITRMISYTQTRHYSYRTFNNKLVEISADAPIEGKELEYYFLDVVIEKEKQPVFDEIKDQLDAISKEKEKEKEKNKYQPNYQSYNQYYGKSYNSYSSDKTLFDDVPEWKSTSWKRSDILDSEDNAPLNKINTIKTKNDLDEDSHIKKLVAQIVTGSVLVDYNAKTDIIKWCKDKMVQQCAKRFGGDIKVYSTFMEGFVQSLIDSEILTTDNYSYNFEIDLINKLLDELNKIPTNTYIEACKRALENYLTVY